MNDIPIRLEACIARLVSFVYRIHPITRLGLSSYGYYAVPSYQLSNLNISISISLHEKWNIPHYNTSFHRKSICDNATVRENVYMNLNKLTLFNFKDWTVDGSRYVNIELQQI